MKRKARARAALSLTILLLLLALGLLLWERFSLSGRIDPLFYSRPSLIWRELCHMLQSGLLWKHASVTLQEAALGLLYGCLLGSAMGILLGLTRRTAPFLLPILTGLNSIPKLALAPLLILWFGIGLQSKVLMASLMVFFIFSFNLYAAYRSVDADLVHTLRLLGANRLQIIRHVVWPSCLPWFLASLRTALGLSLSGAIVGELIGASRGLGWLMSDAASRYELGRVLACVFVIVLFMMCLDALLRLLERKLLKWRPES